MDFLHVASAVLKGATLGPMSMKMIQSKDRIYNREKVPVTLGRLVATRTIATENNRNGSSPEAKAVQGCQEIVGSLDK